MSIINEALKKTQTNLNDLKEKTLTVTDDRISAGQKAWQSPRRNPRNPLRKRLLPRLRQPRRHKPNEFPASVGT